MPLADRASDRAHVYVALAAASLALSAGYFLTPTYAMVLAVSLALAIAPGHRIRRLPIRWR